DCVVGRYPSLAVFFFFQAEDGIRDWSVTGVQTCALPISSDDQLRGRPPRHRSVRGGDSARAAAGARSAGAGEGGVRLRRRERLCRLRQVDGLIQWKEEQQ